MSAALSKLHALRHAAGPSSCPGLPDSVIAHFLERDPSLTTAIEQAAAAAAALTAEERALLHHDESTLLPLLQADYVNFYDEASINPYAALAAHGPWVITAYGAVLHDNGGYGMLGFGHSPRAVIDAMCAPHVMANVMTPSLSHLRFSTALKAEVGHRRAGGCPFSRFLCLNSGSESVTIAMRISDINAANLTKPGARHAGKSIRLLSIRGGFHGRTDRPAQASDSSRKKYTANLASFRDLNILTTVPPNDIEALRAAFARADADNVFFELFLIEPVMGEGNPGEAVTRAFYDEARRLTAEHGTLLLVDSIQAGLRAHGVLSIVDYPGFEDADAPDLETYSKALNAGQYPLSVLATTDHTAGLYVRGVYGNTMTTNPRALEVGCAVLSLVTPEMRANIADRGHELVQKLTSLADDLHGCITKVQGTGLLVSAELDPDRFIVVGFGGVEEYCRRHGVGVIHGGQNALRFTPHFMITSDEVDLLINVVRDALVDALGQAAAK